MPYEMVSGVGRLMGEFDGGGDRRRGMGSFGVNVGRPIETNRDFVEWLCESDGLFQNYFGRTCYGSRCTYSFFIEVSQTKAEIDKHMHIQSLSLLKTLQSVR